MTIQNATDPFSFFSNEISLTILLFLKCEQLAKIFLVSKRWMELASDSSLWEGRALREFSSRVKVFDKADWETYFGYVIDDEPLLDKKAVILELKKSFSLSIEGNAGVTVLTVPKDISFQDLRIRAEHPQLGKKTEFQFIWDPSSYGFDQKLVQKTYRVIITNHLLEGSSKVSAKEQNNFVAKNGCRMPKTIEAMALAVAAYAPIEKNFSVDKTKENHTYCLETTTNKIFTVGLFPPQGRLRFEDHTLNNHRGVLGVRDL